MSEPAPSIDLQQFLAEMFSAHGVAASADGAWVRLPQSYTRCLARVASEQQTASATVIQLDVLVFIGFGQLVGESCAGVGETRGGAVADALKTFATGSLHVLLAAVFKPDAPDEQVSREEWLIGGIPRRVTLGGGIYKAFGGEGAPKQFDVRWFDQFKQAVCRQELPPGTHWVRVYHAHDGATPLETEVLLDNADWPAVRSEAEGFVWPTGGGFASVRLFLMIQGGGPELADLAGVIAGMPSAREDEIAAEMVHRGLASESLAEQAVALVPLAFGRAMLGQLPMTFPSDATLMVDGRQPRTLRLDDCPVFRRASKMARDALAHHTLSRDEFETLALRSAEVRAINEAMNAGSKPENLVLSPPVLFASHEWDSTEMQPIPSTAPLAASSAAESAKKPWWRIW